jgi:hypothetical protein
VLAAGSGGGVRGTGADGHLPSADDTVGVDLSYKDAGTASYVIAWSGSSAVVIELTLGVDNATITDLVGRVAKIGIDVPLGWPAAFVDAIAQHARDGSWPEDYRHADTSAYRYRRTDVSLWKMLKTSPPLSVSTDRIGIPAMRAAALISRLPAPVPLDGSGVLVEVYPAAALHRWGLPSRGYKRKENSVARRELVERFRARTAGWLRLSGTHFALCLASDDAFDALIAALVARAVTLDLVETIPPEHHAAALREGWIAVPRLGSLDLLARL